MRLRLPAAVGALVAATALLLSACGSNSKTSSTTAPTTTSPQATFQAGPEPCRLITPQVVLVTLSQRMTQVSKSKSSCSYMNAARTNSVTVSTAKTTRAGAEGAVSSSAHIVKVKVLHPSGIGDSAIAYVNTTKTRSIATVLFAKNGSIVFLNVGSPSAAHLLPKAVALAKVAASHAS